MPDDTQQSTDSRLTHMRIIIVIGVLDLGGSERQALTLAQYLRNVTEADVEICGCDPGQGRVAQLCDELGIPWRLISLPWKREWGRVRRTVALIKFARDLRRARPDVLLPYISLMDIFCGLVWKFTGARSCIWSQREALISQPVGPRKELLAAQRTPWFTSNSQHGADFLINKLNVSPDRVQVVRNAIQLPAAKSDRATWRRKLRLRDEEFVAVMIANLHILKDHATLIRAWQTVTSNRPATLLLAGRDDGLENALKLQAFDLGLSGQVKFLGAVEDIAGLLSACDLGVLSSPSEGSPNGILECMSAGLPVVGTDVPGIREAVGAEGSLFLAPAKDAEALAAKILTLADNQPLRRQLGDLNRRRIQTTFSVSKLGEDTTSVILKSLGPAAGLKQT